MNTEGDGEGGKNEESSTDIYTTMCKIVERSHIEQGIQFSALWGPGWVGWKRKGGRLRREGTYVYLWLIHNVI